MMVRKPHPPREIVVWIAIALLVISVLFFYLWHINEKHRLGLRTTTLEAQLKLLGEEVSRLETRKAALLALDRVDRIARQSLGLAEPRPDQIVVEER
ncbi:MAG: cell division protein FtsL [Candidatus Aminicenantes bacterium]|nr:cell division protein FtsL [Candidatus Aminicenantes bacterium]